MHVATDHQIEAVAPTATAVHDEHTPGVRIRYGAALYLSLTIAEGIALIDALVGALAELEQVRGLVSDENQIAVVDKLSDL
jgi:hypothetical protein